ncbi:hypothetical protein GGD89_002536, partial [Roseospira visakhapatnamensis]|nr:hypothetical protein [Roseospira visakhapatnamensis]
MVAGSFAAPDVAADLPAAETTDADHGRVEVRKAVVSTDLSWLSGPKSSPQEPVLLPGLACLGLIDPAEVMAPYAREVLERSSAGGVQPIVIIDQSQATRLHRHEMLMVAVRLGERALPLTWIVRKTSGALGFAEQKVLLERVAAWLPDGVKPVLMGDRFYGSP